MHLRMAGAFFRKHFFAGLRCVTLEASMMKVFAYFLTIFPFGGVSSVSPSSSSSVCLTFFLASFSRVEMALLRVCEPIFGGDGADPAWQTLVQVVGMGTHGSDRRWGCRWGVDEVSVRC
jgi:hypothetical protein